MESEPRTTAVILIVEDEGSIRRLAARALQRAGYEVLEARSGSEALEIVHEQVGDIDLVLTDMVMPEMSGPELSEKLRERWPDVRVLYTSGYTELTGRKDIAFLRKPFSAQQLLQEVRLALQEAASA